MKRRVEWSADALGDLAGQIAYIADSDPDAAALVAQRIRRVGAALADYATGHPGRVIGAYEKSVAGLPYVIAYSLMDEARAVFILRLIHTARDWPPEDWPDQG